ncbi:hypothetical protein MAR_007099 [Mya arenaria]|uniref:Protein quiver n=1 Tax=Mya arenaria TaxID=6604 RepID=A0ABY7DCJ1_MYAAR|nr:uncharacterized protein LOC128239561 [Mya arenaria]XP_052812611.1 uncharacterized protein LOC128240129 [Mya arenaria]WAQ94381.1 hypothetical protein MAR_006852 [Mya arenaria]WAQ94628.1 hypothetical protein MAR_007099 [Mya arenaria]
MYIDDNMDKLIIKMILMMLPSLCLSMKCFECNSEQLPRECSSVFKLTKENATYIRDDCDTCLKVYFVNGSSYQRHCRPKVSSGYHLSLGCEKDGDKRTCYCQEELCNGARSELAAFTIMIFVCISAYLLYSFMSPDTLHL